MCAGIIADRVYPSLEGCQLVKTEFFRPLCHKLRQWSILLAVSPLIASHRAAMMSQYRGSRSMP